MVPRGRHTDKRSQSGVEIPSDGDGPLKGTGRHERFSAATRLADLSSPGRGLEVFGPECPQESQLQLCGVGLGLACIDGRHGEFG